MDCDYFDFTTKEELPEEHSEDTRECPHCKKPIPADSLFCLYCGEAVSPSNKKNIWAAALVIFVLIAFLCWIFIQ